jgi:NAD(P)-dependent dehydrogenase (short-subunit alcohol dehydrogenase family)
VTRSTLITGGASGIGRKLAQLLAARGDRVTVLDRTPAEGVVAVDVRDAAAVRAALDAARPRLVINSAGIQLAKRFSDLTEEEYRRVVEVNLLGSRNVAAAAWPHLVDGGHLVLVSSLAGLTPLYGYAAYSASKYGVVGLAEVLRVEGRPEGIRVSCVCPPEVETPMVEEERRTMLPATEALKGIAGTLDVDTAAREILTGIDRGAFLIVPGRRGRAARMLTRLAPTRVAHALADRAVAKALRR